MSNHVVVKENWPSVKKWPNCVALERALAGCCVPLERAWHKGEVGGELATGAKLQRASKNAVIRWLVF